MYLHWQIANKQNKKDVFKLQIWADRAGDAKHKPLKSSAQEDNSQIWSIHVNSESRTRLNTNEKKAEASIQNVDGLASDNQQALFLCI